MLADYRKNSTALTIWARPLSRQLDAGSVGPWIRTMAGAPGFEPGNGGSKVRCLTTWRRPNGSRAAPSIGALFLGLAYERSGCGLFRNLDPSLADGARHGLQLRV